MDGKQNEVIDMLLTILLGYDMPKNNVNIDTVKKLHDLLTGRCSVCGAFAGVEYLSKYGICCGCYAHMVCADGVTSNEPNPQRVLQQIYEIVEL